MLRCHDCNSQVTENDAFCPYCGALLQIAPAEPILVAEVVEEDVSASATTERDMARAVSSRGARRARIQKRALPRGEEGPDSRFVTVPQPQLFDATSR